MYELTDGRLVWREVPTEANAHLEIAVADAADGRFVPALDISLTVLEGDQELFTITMPFLWHPYLYHAPAPSRSCRAGNATAMASVSSTSSTTSAPRSSSSAGSPTTSPPSVTSPPSRSGAGDRGA
jgi:hypothetical protein